jgi:hypothetical protein
MSVRMDQLSSYCTDFDEIRYLRLSKICHDYLGFIKILQK